MSIQSTRKIDHKNLIGQKMVSVQSSFTKKDAIFYALCVGFSQDPLDPQSLEYTYEAHENYKITPTFATVLNKVDIMALSRSLKYLPSFFDERKLVHGTQRTQFFKPFLKPDSKYVTHGQVSNVQDKGKLAILSWHIKTYQKLDNGKQQLAYANDYSLVYMGCGGFGFSGVNKVKDLPKQPSRKSDYLISARSFANQAFFYRLNSDPNPLHIIPKQAEKLGFKIPILHGLCTEGIIIRAIIQQILKNQVHVFKAIQIRFVGHVFPGQSFSIQVWKEEGYLYFKATIKQRNSACLVGIIQLTQLPKM